MSLNSGERGPAFIAAKAAYHFCEAFDGSGGNWGVHNPEEKKWKWLFNKGSALTWDIVRACVVLDKVRA